MSLANAITIARGLLIAPILVLFFHGLRLESLILFGVASASDIVDGMVARARGEITTWGKVLDPLIDKALYLALLFALYVDGSIAMVPLVLFLVPQVCLGIGALVLRIRVRAVQQARIFGKLASLLSFGAIFFLLARWPGGDELFYAAIGATYLASIDYFRAAIRVHGTST
jgi:phosphatidylglycerophosphate synthase